MASFLSGAPARIHGELGKEGRRLHTRKKRYFRLIDGALYNHRRSNTPATWVLSVLDCHVFTDVDRTEILIRSHDGKEVRVIPPDAQACDAWVHELTKASQRKLGLYYGLVGIIGTGSFAEVRLGFNRVDAQQVAIKIMRKNKRDRELMTSVTCEMKYIERRLEHEKIVSTLDMFNTKDNLFIVMEYMAGGMLFELLCSEGHFNEKKAASVMKDLLEALAYLHDNDIVHRDVKPENLLCSRNEWPTTVKLADFGLADVMLENNFGDKCVRGMYGTPFFVAPEVVCGVHYGPEVDVWSAGVLMYNMLSGKLPFDGSTLKEVLRNVRKAKLVFSAEDWRGVSDEAQDLIQCLLKPNPADRLTARQALGHSWILRTNQSEAKLQYDTRMLRGKHHSSVAMHDVKLLQNTVETDEKHLAALFLKGGLLPKWKVGSGVGGGSDAADERAPQRREMRLSDVETDSV